MTGDINTWFNGWDRIADIMLSAVAVYTGTILLVRLSGKRTTSQMNNFDWIITVALGGLVASGILLQNVSVADSLVAAAWLMFMQWCLTTLTLRSKMVKKMITATPTLLVDNGKMLEDNMIRERISESEIMGVLRENGLHELDQVKWVIMETDATLSVISTSTDRPDEPQILSDVQRR